MAPTGVMMDLNDPNYDPLANLSRSDLRSLASLLRHTPCSFSRSSSSHRSSIRSYSSFSSPSSPSPFVSPSPSRNHPRIDPPNRTAVLPASFLTSQHAIITSVDPPFPARLLRGCVKQEGAAAGGGGGGGGSGSGSGSGSGGGVRGFIRAAVHRYAAHSSHPPRSHSSSPSSSFSSSPPLLCAAHAALNEPVVRGLYGLLQREVGVRVDCVRWWLERRRCSSGSSSSGSSSSSRRGAQLLAPGEERDREEVVEQRRRMREYVERMNGIATLWLDWDEFERWYGEGAVLAPSGEEASECRLFERVESGCPACVLAVVGGRRELLVALRASVEARAGGKDPRLLRFVDAWIDAFAEAGGDEDEGGEAGRMRKESFALAEEIRRVRIANRRWKQERRREREKRGGGPDGRRRGGDDGKGRSKHRGGLPSGTPVVDGVPMPQVRMRRGDAPRPESRRSPHAGRDPDPHPHATLSWHSLSSATEDDSNSWCDHTSSVSSSSAPNDSPSLSGICASTNNPDGEFIPARAHWRTSTGRISARRPVSQVSASCYSRSQLPQETAGSALPPGAPTPSEYLAVQKEVAQGFISRTASARTTWPGSGERSRK